MTIIKINITELVGDTSIDTDVCMEWLFLNFNSDHAPLFVTDGFWETDLSFALSFFGLLQCGAEISFDPFLKKTTHRSYIRLTDKGLRSRIVIEDGQYYLEIPIDDEC